ncbi:MAG: hypothetical protein HKN91_17760 [Acidimicrobiia bacterium]|nr:hypothetical protein [Acidimicrobiia bacterium]
MNPPPDLVVMPNDGAYPYDRITDYLDDRAIPYLILQEGIRFERAAGNLDGSSNAAAWAVWGNSSASYFRRQGAHPGRIHVTGSPRFDVLANETGSTEAKALADELSDGKPILALLSNPIDDLGFVTRSEKLALIRDLATASAPMLVERDWHMVIKLHGRESLEACSAAVGSAADGVPVSVVSDCPLYPLLGASRGALTFASSVGLEALLAGVPLAVVELPKHGFVHDYVSSGAAAGIRLNRALDQQIASWLEGSESREKAVGRYLDENVAHAGVSAVQVADLVQQLTHPPHKRSR